jgi:anaphase-promoting complex subunit 2
MLEDRLLSLTSLKSEKFDEEKKNLEFMKIRFGEAYMHPCAVMTRDMMDSHRICDKLNSSKFKHGTMAYGLDSKKMPVKIISRGYWNKILDEEKTTEDVTDFKMDGQVVEVFKQFNDNYQVDKKNKQLTLKPNLGYMDLTLTFDNGPFSFHVTPLEASIITLFNSPSAQQLSAAQISEALDITPQMLRKRISFWLCKGVLKEFKQNVSKSSSAPRSARFNHES